MAKKRVNSRIKGKNGELDALAALKALGISGHRSQQYSGADADADLVLDPPFDWLHVEVKRVENFNVYKAMEQAEEDCTDPEKTPVVLHRRSRKGWITILPLAEFARLMKERSVSEEIQKSL